MAVEDESSIAGASLPFLLACQGKEKWVGLRMNAMGATIACDALERQGGEQTSDLFGSLPDLDIDIGLGA
jgi:hypothetical protein